MLTIDCSGTGTQAGDPNELRSIRGVFAQARRSDDKLHVTSLKSNIGHLEAASGGAALAKLLLMLRHKRIPPQALLQRLNPAIVELGTDGTHITTEAIDWAAKGKKRTALLNNFGVSDRMSDIYRHESFANIYLPYRRLQDRTELYCYKNIPTTPVLMMLVKNPQHMYMVARQGARSCWNKLVMRCSCSSANVEVIQD